MTCEISADDVRRSTRAKSDQLNADDLCGGPITGIVTTIRKGSSEQPVQIQMSCWHVPWRPCKTELRVLSGLFGEEPAKWLGKTLRLKRDPKTLWGGEAVGGVRIDGASGIAGEYRVMLAFSKGKKAPRVVVPIPALESAPAVAPILLPKWAEQGNEPLDPDQADEIVALAKAHGVGVEVLTGKHGDTSKWATATAREIVGRLQEREAQKRAGGAK